MPGTKCPTVRSSGTTSVRSALMPTLMTSRASMIFLYDLQQALLRIDFHLGAVGDGCGDVLLEAREHSHVAKRGALREDRIDRIQDDRQRHNAARFHLMKHPRRRHAALGGVQHQYPADIGLTSQLVRRAAEDALDAVEIVSRGKSIVRDQCAAAHDRSHGVPGLEDSRAHVRTSLPLTAASTHDSIEASIGR